MGKLWGLRPQTPLKIKKRFKPALLSALREQQGGKKKRGRMGAIRPQTPNQEQSSWTSSVGASHTRHDTGWRPPQLPENTLGSYENSRWLTSKYDANFRIDIQL